MSYSFDKNKNEHHNKYENEFPDTVERGGCLTAFLVVLAILNAGSVIILMGGMGVGSRSALPAEFQSLPPFFLFLEVVSSLLIVVFAVALWNWKSWGYNGLRVLYVLGAIMYLVTMNIVAFVALLLEFGVLYYLMKDKADYLE